MSYYPIDNLTHSGTNDSRVTHIHFVKTAISKAMNWLERKRAIADLEALDDHLLEDIGIARNDIPRVVRSSLLQTERCGGWPKG